MPIHELQTLRVENQALRAELRFYTGARRNAAGDHVATSDGERLLLLRMAEGLVDAHRAAKQDANGVTIGLIQAALFHVGGRLARVHEDKSRLRHQPRLGQS